MILKEFVKELKDIMKVHPETSEAQIWCGGIPIKFVGLDKRHKPIRVKLQ